MNLYDAVACPSALDPEDFHARVALFRDAAIEIIHTYRPGDLTLLLLVLSPGAQASLLRIYLRVRFRQGDGTEILIPEPMIAGYGPDSDLGRALREILLRLLVPDAASYKAIANHFGDTPDPLPLVDLEDCPPNSSHVRAHLRRKLPLADRRPDRDPSLCQVVFG